MSPSAFTTNGVPPNGGADERQGWQLSKRLYGMAMIWDVGFGIFFGGVYTKQPPGAVEAGAAGEWLDG